MLPAEYPSRFQVSSIFMYFGKGIDEVPFANGEGAPAHTGADSARRCGPAVLWFSKLKVNPATRASFEIIYEDIVFSNSSWARFDLIVNS